MQTNLLHYGRPDPLPERHHLRAGELEMIYEEGFLRYLTAGGVEVLRMIYHAVRDHNWDTIPGQLENEELDIGEDRFEIRYDSVHRQGDIHFVWHCRVVGEADGSVLFEIRGKALSTFRKNRIGFCVLHPASCAGHSCKIIHSDGSREKGAFPQVISPHQPFLDMRAMNWKTPGKGKAELLFAGDIFEMEDQRNWTDASFKTYCTPLAVPFPVTLREGDEVAQRIEFRLKKKPAVKVPEAGRIRSGIGEERPLPALGVGASSRGGSLSAVEAALLKQLRFDHYRQDIKFREAGWREGLRAALLNARAMGAGLELALFFGDDPRGELQAFLDAWPDDPPAPLCVLLLYHRDTKSTPGELIERLMKPVWSAFPETLIGAGSDAYFTELNRERTPSEHLDLLSYSINPQVHAFDNASLTETLEAQRYTVESAATFSGGRPVWVSPVTLQPRFNPNATGSEPPVPPGELPPQVDPRQLSLYGAAWTLGSLKYLSEVGVKGVTYYETIGWRGLLQGERPPPVPEKFPATPGQVFPLYFVFWLIAPFRAGVVVPTQSPRPLAYDAWRLREGDRQLLLLTNFTAEVQSVAVEGLPAVAGRFALHAGNYDQLSTLVRQTPESLFETVTLEEKVELEAFATVFLMWRGLDGRFWSCYSPSMTEHDRQLRSILVNFSHVTDHDRS